MFLRRLGSFFVDIIEVFVFAVSIFLFIYLLILQPHKIKGSSMEPNFQDGEYLLTDKLSYRFGEPVRGDVVVFKAPPDYKDEFIKRIIGLPSDEIKIEGDMIFINGIKLPEKYLPKGQLTLPGNFLPSSKALKVPENFYFVLGDNRDHSFDSRNIGFVSRDKITGKAWFIYWPIKDIGTIEAYDYNN